MTQVQTSEVSTLNPRERSNLISSIISEGFFSHWGAEAIGGARTPAKISWARADGVTVTHSHMPSLRLINHCAASRRSRKFYASVADQMTMVYLAGGRQVQLFPGDIILLGSDMPTEWVIGQDYEHGCLIIDEEIMREYLPNYLDLVGMRLNFSFSLQELLRGMIESAWFISCAGMFDAAGPKLAQSFLELLAVGVIARKEGGTAGGRNLSRALELRRNQIKNYINRHYYEPTLSVNSIARGLQLSSRYVQLALAEENITPSEYIRRVRLAESAKLLSDQQEHNKSITEICFDCGFNSSSHFSTQFRKRFGVSPRHYRSEARYGGASEPSTH